MVERAGDVRDFGNAIVEHLFKNRSTLGLSKDPKFSKPAIYPVQEPNIAYLIHADGRPLLCKLDWSRSSDYPLSQEFHKLRALEKFNIAPKALDYDAEELERPLLITELTPGKKLSRESLPANLQQVFNGMTMASRVPLAELIKTPGFEDSKKELAQFPFTLLNATEKKLKDYLDCFTNNHITETVEESIVIAREHIPRFSGFFTGEDPCLVNSSLYAENILLDGLGRTKFIEWDRSKIGDKAFDAYLLMKLNLLSKGQQVEVLDLHDNSYRELLEKIIALDPKNQNKVLDEYGGPYSNFHVRACLYHDLSKIRDLIAVAYKYEESMKKNYPKEIQTNLAKKLEETKNGFFKKELIPAPKSKKKIVKKNLETVLKSRPKPLTLKEKLKQKVKDFSEDYGWKGYLAVAAAATITALGIHGTNTAYQKHQNRPDKVFHRIHECFKEGVYTGYDGLIELAKGENADRDKLFSLENHYLMKADLCNAKLKQQGVKDLSEYFKQNQAPYRKSKVEFFGKKRFSFKTEPWVKPEYKIMSLKEYAEFKKKSGKD